MIFSKNNVFIKFVIWAVVVAFVLSLFIFAGMFQYERNQRAADLEKAKEWDAKGKVSEADAGKPLATVNGAPVTAGEFFAFYHERLNQEMRNFYSTRDKLVTLLEQYVDKTLLDKRLAEFQIPEAEVARELADLLPKMGIPSREELAKVLESRGMSLAQFENEQVRRNLQQKRLMDDLANPREITEKSLQDYFAAHKDRFVKATVAPDGSTVSVPMEFAEARASIEAALATEVTDEMIEAYYGKHKERWRGPGIATVAHLLVREGEAKRKDAIQPTDADLQAWYQINRHLKKFHTRDKVTLRSILVSRENAALLERVTLSDEELAAWFEKNRHQFTETGHVEVRNLLLANDRIETPEDEASLRAFYGRRGRVDCRHILVAAEAGTLAVELVEKLRAENTVERFAELAKEHSTDPGSKDNGGVYADVPRGRMVRPFEEAIFSLPVGEISDPVKTDFGWHIVRVDAERGQFDGTFEEKSDEVLVRYRDEERARIANERAAAIRREIDGGMKFEDAVRRHSHGPAAKDAPVFKVMLAPGKPGEFTAEMSGEIAFGGSVAYTLREAVKALKPGETSEPVKSVFGTHLLHAVARVDDKTPELDEVREAAQRLAKIDRTAPLCLERANEILRRAERGLKFDALVAEYSDGPLAKSGGRIGPFEPAVGVYGIPAASGEISLNGQTLLPEIAQALARARTAGRTLPPIETQLGAHLLLVEAVDIAVPRKFEEVREMVRQDYLREKDAEAARRDAEAAAKRIAEGAAFEAVVREFSDAASRERDGLLGTFEVGAQQPPADPELRKALKGEVMANDWALIPEFAQVVFAEPVGRPTQLVKSQLGHHIFLVKAREKGPIPPLAELREKIRDIFTTGTVVTDEEVATEYERSAEDYRVPAKIRVKSLLAGSEAEAAEFRRRIVEGGEPFDEVARKHSIDPVTKEKGGDGGLVAEESLDPALRDALAKVEAGKVTEPVKVSGGFVIAQAMEKVAEKRTPLDEVRGAIRERLLEPKRRALFDEYIKELRHAAEIVWAAENFHLLDKYSGSGGAAAPPLR